MAAFMVVNVYMREANWVADYVAAVPDIIRKYGGEYLAVSGPLQKFEGEGATPDRTVIFSFPTLAAIDEFMKCEEYRPWKEKRLAESSADIIGFETV